MQSDTYPAARPWRLPARQGLELPYLSAAWRRSAETLGLMSRLLAAGPLDEAVRSVALSGSLGRMEQVARSDVDLVVIIDPEAARIPERATQAYDSVWSCLRPSGGPPPKGDGIFAAAYGEDRFDRFEDRGTIAEDLATFGIRMQLLLDCQPVFGTREFERLRRRVLRFYASDWHPGGVPSWEYLVNDLLRYFRSMAVHGLWTLRDRPGAWRLRNLKRLHSRRLLYSGLLFLLGESTAGREDPFSWVLRRLPLTPLERLAEVFADEHAGQFERVASRYETFLRSLAEPRLRGRLEAGDGEAGDGEPGDGEAGPECQPDFRRLQENGQQLAAELAEFVWGRHGRWSERFLSQLLF